MLYCPLYVPERDTGAPGRLRKTAPRHKMYNPLKIVLSIDPGDWARGRRQEGA